MRVFYGINREFRSARITDTKHVSTFANLNKLWNNFELRNRSVEYSRGSSRALYDVHLSIAALEIHQGRLFSFTHFRFTSESQLFADSANENRCLRDVLRLPLSKRDDVADATFTSGLNVWSRRQNVRSFDETSLRRLLWREKGSALEREELRALVERTSVKESQDVHCRVLGTLCALLQTGFLWSNKQDTHTDVHPHTRTRVCARARKRNHDNVPSVDARRLPERRGWLARVSTREDCSVRALSTTWPCVCVIYICTQGMRGHSYVWIRVACMFYIQGILWKIYITIWRRGICVIRIWLLYERGLCGRDFEFVRIYLTKIVRDRN